MFVGLHNHTDIGSNVRGFLDSTNKVDSLIKYAKEIGYQGICITDHDCISAHMDAQNIIKNLREKEKDKWNDFKLILGNEIYLCSKKEIEEKNYNFYHFILIAKDEIGHKQIRELSTRAWCDNSFVYVNIRTPTYFDDLFEVVEENRGHLIASTACLGGQFSKLILEAYEKDAFNPDYTLAKKWLKRMVKCFGDGNFFLEMQPSEQESQIIVNKAIIKLSYELNIPYIVTCDAHYLKLTDKPIHEAFLKSNDSSNGERELGDFYNSTFVQSESEIHGYMDKYIGYDVVQKAIDNTMLVYNMCKEYDLSKPLEIPYVAFDKTEPSKELYEKYKNKIPLIQYFYESKIDSDRHLCRDLLNKFEERPEEFCNEETYSAVQDCLDAIITSSEKQKTAWSGYLLQCKELIKTIWESGSLCGPARGSGTGFILLYMLDITQINPLREDTKTYYWRFLHSQRASVLDIDCDSEGSKKGIILENLKKKYGGYRYVSKVQTILTAKAKNAIQIACRGLGYTSEEGIFLASFIKAERGIQYTLTQTFYGDEENNIAPDKEFVNLMTSKYSDVWEVAKQVEGLCVGVGSHAGGVIVSSKDMTEVTALMKTGSGDIITQFDLHKDEQVGLIKFDLLNIDALEKIHIELNLLLEDGLIEWQGDLKSTYEKYLGVYNLDRDNPEIWEMIQQHKIMSLFQFEKASGYQAIELGKPEKLSELTALNSVMRLMAQEGQTESPLKIYNKHRLDISTWYKEMDDWGLTKEEQKIVEKYALDSYGLLANQEQFMVAVQDPALGGWDLIFGDRLRKSVAKKLPKDFIELQNQFFDRMRERHLSEKLCTYVWSLIAQNKGYSFNASHTLSYSIVGLQEANLAYKYPIVYWNCANLISDSGGEDGNTNYGKIASAIGNMQKAGIKVVLPDINRVRFSFHPDAEKNEIVFGLKGIQGVGTNIANAIISKQTYTSMWDFYSKMQEYKSEAEENKFGDTAMICLIKAGCFDEVENRPRQDIMRDFIKSISNPVKKLQMSNIEDLAKLGLLTPEQKSYELRLYRFKNYVCNKKNFAYQKGKSGSTAYYKLDRKFAEPFFYEHFETNMEEGKDYEYTEDGYIAVKRGSLEREFEKLVSDFKKKVLTNQEILDKVNEARFNEVWEEKASGTVSKWEMDSLSYYYHEHELAHVDRDRYVIESFDNMSSDSEVADHYFYRGQQKPRFKLYRICGTVIDKDKNHHTVTLLTPDGVVTVKFYKGQFGFYDRQISEVGEDGTKTVLEKSWFSRGTKLLITGYRRDEQFIPKKYSDSIFKHSVQLIKDIDEEGILSLQSERIGQEKEEGML